MSKRGYEIVRLDELESLPASTGSPVFRPIRRRLGVRAFGINCWSGETAGDQVIERHREADGPEELYLVVAGRAAFTVDTREIDAPAGTLVFVPPGIQREAVAAEDGTTVLAVGAKPGEAFAPVGWDEFYVADGYRRAGEVEQGREVVEAALQEHPSRWQGHFNAACFEALAGDRDAALAHLQRAVAIDRDEVRTHAATDSDLDSLRDDARLDELLA